MKRAIISTSTSCLDTQNLPANTLILPMNIQINGVDYLDGETITTKELFYYMTHYPNQPPITSPPDTAQLIDFFYNLVEQGYDEVFVITLSSQFSQTHANIVAIKDLFINKITIHLYDSLISSYGEAVLVHKAADMLNNNPDIDMIDIALELNKIRQKIHMFITVDTLKTMVQTKRISAVAGFFGDFLGIKPIVEVNKKGQITPFEKIRGFESSLNRLVELVDQNYKNSDIYIMANDNNLYLELLNQKLINIGRKHTPLTPVASTVLANMGINAMGIMSITKDKA